MTLAAAYESVRVLLARGILASRVYDSVRKNGATAVRDNYAVLIDETPRRERHRYTVLQLVDGRMRHRFDVRSVSTSTGGRRMYQDAVSTNLIGEVPQIAGRVCTAIEMVDPIEEGMPKYDQNADLYHVTDSFQFWSDPA